MDKNRKCEDCMNCVHICEGDCICMFKEKLVIEDFNPTEEYKPNNCEYWLE